MPSVGVPADVRVSSDVVAPSVGVPESDGVLQERRTEVTEKQVRFEVPSRAI